MNTPEVTALSDEETTLLTAQEWEGRLRRKADDVWKKHAENNTKHVGPVVISSSDARIISETLAALILQKTPIKPLCDEGLIDVFARLRVGHVNRQDPIRLLATITERDERVRELEADLAEANQLAEQK